jgi:hypothetical protein
VEWASDEEMVWGRFFGKLGESGRDTVSRVDGGSDGLADVVGGAVL